MKTFEISNIYKDDVVFVAHTVDCFNTLYKVFEFKIILKAKTKVIFTHEPGELYTEPDIVVHGTRVGVVDIFIYTGSMLSRVGSLDAEMHLCIQTASVVFVKLEKIV